MSVSKRMFYIGQLEARFPDIKFEPDENSLGISWTNPFGTTGRISYEYWQDYKAEEISPATFGIK